MRNLVMSNETSNYAHPCGIEEGDESKNRKQRVERERELRIYQGPHDDTC
jgi:hypothetical protein